MAKNFTGQPKPRRVPPGIDPFRFDIPANEEPGVVASVEPNECTPPEQLDAVKARADALIAKGERLDQSVDRLRSTLFRMRSAPASRAEAWLDEIDRIITFAETGK